MNEQAIKTFLKTHPRYVNPFNILVTSNGQKIVVSSLFDSISENPQQHFMGNSCFCESYEQFSGLFNIYDENDILIITPKHLQRLYRVGQADLFCALDDHQALLVLYRKINGKMMVRVGENVAQLVTEKLVTNDDYMNHTRKFVAGLRNLLR